MAIEQMDAQVVFAEASDDYKRCCQIESRPRLTISDQRMQVDRDSVKKQLATVRRQVAEARSQTVPGHEKNAKVFDLISSSLRRRGQFFNDGVRAYVFLRDTRILLPIDAGQLGVELLLRDYGLFPSEQVAQLVIDGLRLEAHAEGQRTEVHAFAYYDAANHKAYLYDFGGGIYCIAPDMIERVNNGADGVLFTQNPQWAPLDLGTGGTPNVRWRDVLLQGLRFAEGTLSVHDHKVAFTLWVLSLFFPQIFPTRIVLAMIGEKGSGKSSLLRRTGQLLFGPNFNVSALTSKPDDFDAAITTDPFVVADNADDAPRWFPDRLAVVATGGTIKRRTYYTTNSLGEFPIRARLAVTSRTPNFQREDVAERLLPLNLERIEQFKPEAELLREIQSNRTEIFLSLVMDVQRAVIELRNPSGNERATGFRMADFADFAMKVAPVVATRQEMPALLDRLANQQVNFASQDEPLLALLDAWLEDDSNHVNIHREITVPALGRELERVGGNVPWARGNAGSFGQYFRSRKGTLARLYAMTERSGHGGATFVRFTRLRRAPGDVGDLGDEDSYDPYEDEVVTDDKVGK